MKHFHAFHFEYVPAWWLRVTWHPMILTNSWVWCAPSAFAFAVENALYTTPNDYRKARW